MSPKLLSWLLHNAKLAFSVALLFTDFQTASFLTHGLPYILYHMAW